MSRRPISRQAPGVIVVRHRLGFVVANAGIDASNAVPPDAPAGAARGRCCCRRPRRVRSGHPCSHVEARCQSACGRRVTDSFGRPFRLGTVGVAIGVRVSLRCGISRGEADLFGRALEQTITALADQVAAVADLVAGQAAEGRPRRTRPRASLRCGRAGGAGALPQARGGSLRMKVVALSGGVGGARLARRPGPRSPCRRAHGGGQHRRRLRAPRAECLARSGHGDVHARRARARGARLGSCRGVVRGPLDGQALRRARLVCAGRPRSGDPPTSDGGAARGRLAVDGDGASVPALGVVQRVLPMSDAPVRTLIDTEGKGTLPFQQWFVRHGGQSRGCARVRFDGEPAPRSGRDRGARRMRPRRRWTPPTRTSRWIPSFPCAGFATRWRGGPWSR